MDKIIAFFDHPFFIIVGGFSTLIAILTFVYSSYIIFIGIIPVWVRLGKGLSNKKIAVYAEQEFDNLKDLLLDSGLFKEKNIERISTSAMKKGERHTMMLVNYIEFSNKIPEILKYKKDSDSLIIYAPQKDGRIDQQIMDQINENRNSIVVNFRGRLLNDIITSMITTSSYEKR
ncbi:hypothetical protein [Flavobacterium sp. 1355]|uniref:hypothetical protein n=1 Tax=Flavobacterium sp. 1355 TaxID=2806571 RepID=UPI001AE8A2C2|nr:hypothetical protein [Flavobacterium sp. 1355]MBP1223676.1 hypothetical protein [Flavobacterium sp. 1355]